jgi:uncharacterized surface protein with fasciclin (FAS1) repeats
MPSGRRLGLYLIAGVAVFALASSAFAADLLDVAKSNKDLSMFVKAVEAAGMADALKAPGPCTIFAPTDEAFKKFPKTRLMLLMQRRHRTKLAALLKYHMLSGAWPTEKINEMRSGSMVETLEGKKITITRDASGIFVNGAKVITADQKASNGVIHTIDTVLMPSRR